MKFIDKALTLYREKFILSRSILVVSVSLIGNVFAYLFQLISGRYFSVNDYSTLVALFSLGTIIPLVVMVFTNGVVKVVAEIKFDNYPTAISKFFYSLTAMNSIIATVVVIALFMGLTSISDYLNINNPILIKIYIISLGIGILSSHFVPTLQGLLRFKAYSFTASISYLGRFAAVIMVVLLGLGLKELYIGITLAGILATVVAYLLLRKNLTHSISFEKTNIILLLKYSIGGALALLGINFLQNNDIILVKHFFNPEIAGIYSSTSIVGRIIFFAASPVAIVMLPICAERFKKGGNFIKPFLGTLGLTAFIAGSITILYWFFPELFTNTFFGSKYLPGAQYLPLYGSFMFIFAILNIVSLFFVAISEFKLSAFPLLAAGFQYIGINLYKNTLTQVISVSIISVSLSFAVLFFILILRKLKTGHILNTH